MVEEGYIKNINANRKNGVTPSQTQDILCGAGRARGASRFSETIVVIINYGFGVGIATPTVVSQPLVISAFAAVN